MSLGAGFESPQPCPSSRSFSLSLGSKICYLSVSYLHAPSAKTACCQASPPCGPLSLCKHKQKQALLSVSVLGYSISSQQQKRLH